MMPVERTADAELGAELRLLVGAHTRIAVADSDVGITREEDAAVRQALDRRVAAQRVIVGEGILEEGRLERGKVEAPGDGPSLLLRQFDQTLVQNWSSFRANTVWPAALRGPSWASAGGRITSA